MKDLIQNAHTIFEEDPLLFPSPDVEETTSTVASSSLFLSPEFPRSSAGVQAMNSITWHGRGLVGDTPASIQSLPSDASMDSFLTPSPAPFLSPLLGLPPSMTLKGGVETTMQEQIVPEEKGTKAVERVPNCVDKYWGHLAALMDLRTYGPLD